VEDEESLESSAVLCELSDSVHHELDLFPSDGIVTTGIVVCCIFLSSDELLRMEESLIFSSSDLIDDGRLEIKVDSSWHMLSSSSL